MLERVDAPEIGKGRRQHQDGGAEERDACGGGLARRVRVRIARARQRLCRPAGQRFRSSARALASAASARTENPGVWLASSVATDGNGRAWARIRSSSAGAMPG